METRKLCTLATGLLLVGFGFADAAPTCRVIDDFKTGPTSLRLTEPETTADDTQAGSMLGGWRRTWMYLRSNPYRHAAQLTIGADKRPGIPFVLTYPLQALARTEVIYGQAAPGAVLGGMLSPLAYYPTGCDRFRVHVTAAAAHNYVNFVVSAWYQDHYPYYAQGGVNFSPAELGLNSCIDLPFASLLDTGPYSSAEIALQASGIRALTFIIQSGSPGGGEQMAITRIETLDAASAAASPCRVVARRVR
jgi:hypothetical protein